MKISAVIAAGVHLFPFRTEKLSPLAPMVLGAQAPGRVGRRPISSTKGRREAALRLSSRVQAGAPVGIEAAQASDPLRHGGMRLEHARQLVVGEGVDRVERLGRRRGG